MNETVGGQRAVIVRNTGRGEGKREKPYQIRVNREQMVLVMLHDSRLGCFVFRIMNDMRIPE